MIDYSASPMDADLVETSADFELGYNNTCLKLNEFLPSILYNLAVQK